MSQSATLPTLAHPYKEKHASVAAPLLAPSLKDQQLAARVEGALRARGYRELQAVRVSVRTQIVFLGGRVTSYYLKQLAQATVLAILGVQQVRNDLDVVRPK